MTKSSVVAAAILFAFSGASFANDPGSPKSAGASDRPVLSPTAQCDTLVGDKKEQCLRQAQNRGTSGTAAGSAIGSGAAGAKPSSPQGTGGTGGGAASGTVRP